MENQRQQPVSAWEAIIIIIITFFATAFFGAASLFLFGDAITSILGELVVLIVPLIYLVSKKINIVSYVQIKLKPTYLLLGLALGGLLLLLDLGVSSGLLYLIGPSEVVDQSNATIANLSTSTFGLAAVATSLVLAGVCEEFAFRGFLQNSLDRSFRKRFRNPKNASVVAIVISAGAFGLFHPDPQGFYTISAFVSGLALGYIYYRWNNYVVCAAAHATINILVLTLTVMGV